MAGNLPYGRDAIVELGKLEDYCLSPVHPRGRHKARVFRAALGMGRDTAPELKQALLEAAWLSPATFAGVDPWGERWQIDFVLERQNRRAVIRSIWLIRTGEAAARFVTCWVL